MCIPAIGVPANKGAAASPAKAGMQARADGCLSWAKIVSPRRSTIPEQDTVAAGKPTTSAFTSWQPPARFCNPSAHCGGLGQEPVLDPRVRQSLQTVPSRIAYPPTAAPPADGQAKAVLCNSWCQKGATTTILQSSIQEPKTGVHGRVWGGTTAVHQQGTGGVHKGKADREPGRFDLIAWIPCVPTWVRST